MNRPRPTVLIAAASAALVTGCGLLGGDEDAGPSGLDGSSSVDAGVGTDGSLGCSYRIGDGGCSDTTPPQIAPPALAQAEMRDLYVGVAADGPCPQLSLEASASWVESTPLLDACQRDEAGRPDCYPENPYGADRQDDYPQLGKFCLYRREQGDADLTFEPNPNFLIDPVPDLHVMATMPPTIDKPSDVSGVRLMESYLAQVEAPFDPLPEMLNEPPGNVRVAVLDSTSEGAYDSRYLPSLHGGGMRMLIERLACPSGVPEDGRPCVEVVNYLALQMLSHTESGRPRAGFTGTMGQLAEQILQALADWRARKLEAPEEDLKLILNLSIGWDPIWGGNYGATPGRDLTPPALLVHAALTTAVCQGAIVFAAAGNATWGPEPSAGPMYPAAWERQAAPPTCGGNEGLPLVTAVGAVDALDEPLANNRRRGRPRLVAPGRLATINDWAIAPPYAPDDSRPWFGPFTGTSAPTAVASAAAALVWAYNPEQRPMDVLDLLYRYSFAIRLVDGTMVHSDFQLGNEAHPVHRIAVLHAAKCACGVRCDGGQECQFNIEPPNLNQHPPPQIRADLPAIDALPALVPTAGNVYTAAPQIVPHTVEVCGGRVVHAYNHDPLQWPCPSLQVHDARLAPFVDPQPKINPCVLCLLVEDRLYVEINQGISGPLTQPRLVLWEKAGSSLVTTKAYVLNQELAGLSPGSVRKVVMPSVSYDPTHVAAATLEFYIPGTAEVTTVGDVFVVEP